MQGWYLDRDGDGYFAAVQGATTSQGSGWTTTPTKGPDCDDTNPAIGMNCGAVVKWYVDKDRDNWYDKNAVPKESQYPPQGGTYIRDPLGKDCDDTNKNITNHCYKFFYKDDDNDGRHFLWQNCGIFAAMAKCCNFAIKIRSTF